MKHAYAQYQTHAHSVQKATLQRLVERAHIYNVSFLENPKRVEEILALFKDEENTQKSQDSIKNMSKIWNWLEASERKACMS